MRDPGGAGRGAYGTVERGLCGTAAYWDGPCCCATRRDGGLDMEVKFWLSPSEFEFTTQSEVDEAIPTRAPHVRLCYICSFRLLDITQAALACGE